MLVSDIYGENSPFKELASDLLASSFAKVAQDQQPAKSDSDNGLKQKYSPNDVLASLVTMVSINIG